MAMASELQKLQQEAKLMAAQIVNNEPLRTAAPHGADGGIAAGRGGAAGATGEAAATSTDDGASADGEDKNTDD